MSVVNYTEKIYAEDCVSICVGTVLVIIKLTNFAVRCGFVAVPVNLIFVVISPSFAIFKNVEHSLI